MTDRPRSAEPPAHAARPRAAAAALATWFHRLFGSLESLRGRVADPLSDLLTDTGPVTVDAETGSTLRAAVASFLASAPVSDGAGVVLAPQLLRPDTAQLQWWRHDGDALARTEFILDPASERYYDYAALDWFTGPYRDGVGAVAGPYIDYLGIDYYICTVAVPAYAHGRVVGIVGCDIRMQDLERAVLPLLGDVPGAALLGRTRQVLVGNTGRLSTGVLVAAVPPGFRTIPLDVGGAGLELLYRA